MSQGILIGIIGRIEVWMETVMAVMGDGYEVDSELLRDPDVRAWEARGRVTEVMDLSSWGIAQGTEADLASAFIAGEDSSLEQLPVWVWMDTVGAIWVFEADIIAIGSEEEELVKVWVWDDGSEWGRGPLDHGEVEEAADIGLREA